MAFSIAGLLNFRLDSGTRTTGKAVSAARPNGLSARLEKIIEVFRMNSLRFIVGRSFTGRTRTTLGNNRACEPPTPRRERLQHTKLPSGLRDNRTDRKTRYRQTRRLAQ